MTGEQAWSLIAPMIYMPKYNPSDPAADAMIEAYVLTHIGLVLYDNWVANGKPSEWQEKPKKR